MISWTPWQTGKVRPMQNFVLTTSVYQSDKVKVGDVELFQDTTYNPGYHQPIVQKVCAVPKYLTYGRWRVPMVTSKAGGEKETTMINPPIPHSMPWKVPMELKRDDVVYVDSFSLASAEKDNRMIDCEGVKYYLVRYEDIYFRLESGKAWMLNGWCMVEPIENPESELLKRMKSSGLVFPGIKITNENRRSMDVGDKLAVVRHIGLPVMEYIDRSIDVHDEINVGDTVILKLSANRRLEIGGARFFGDKELIVTRRERIVAKVTESPF